MAAAALTFVASSHTEFVRLADPQNPLLSRDWFSPLDGRYVELGPGVPLLLPGPDGELGTKDDQVRPDIVGDIDLVVRVGTQEIVGAIPDPTPLLAGPLPVGIAEPLGGGTPIAFTVIASDGSDVTPYGEPTAPDYLEGLPVLVFAFADLDGDGFIGVTSLDGSAHDEEVEEAELDPVGRRFAFFADGVAAGELHLEVGGPPGAPVRVALAAAMWAGPIDADFIGGNVPKGPAVMTHVPFVPRTDPAYLLEAGADSPDWPLPTSPNDLVGVRISEAASAEAGGPMGEALTLLLDGSDPTTDIALMHSGGFVRFGLARAVDPRRHAEDGSELLRRGLDDTGEPTSYEVLRSLRLEDDGSASQQTVRVIPVDRLGNIVDLTDPAELTARTTGGVRIVSPDADGDLTRETLSVADARGVTLLLDDSGLEFDDANEAALILEGHENLSRIDIRLPDPDVDDSGHVDGGDVQVILDAMEADPRPPPPDLDLDGSGRIREGDLYVVLRNLGSPATPDTGSQIVEYQSGESSRRGSSHRGRRGGSGHSH